MLELTAEFWIYLKTYGRFPFRTPQEPLELLKQEERKVRKLQNQVDELKSTIERMKKKEDQDRKKDKALIEMVYKMALKSLIPEDVELRQFKELNR